MTHIFCLHVATISVFHVHAMEKGIIVFYQQIFSTSWHIDYRWATSQSFWVSCCLSLFCPSIYLCLHMFVPAVLGIIPLTLRFRSLFFCIYFCSLRFWSLHVCMFVCLSLLIVAGEWVTLLTFYVSMCLCLSSQSQLSFVCLYVDCAGWVGDSLHFGLCFYVFVFVFAVTIVVCVFVCWLCWVSGWPCPHTASGMDRCRSG